jgi:hypothetical protein
MTLHRSSRTDIGPERDTDRLLAEWFADEARVHEPPVLLPSALARTALTRRRPAWRVPDRWLWPSNGRAGGFWRTHPMSSAITALALVSGASLLLLTAAADGDLPALLGAGTGKTIVVAQDDSGDFDTVVAAIAEAADGDTIVVRPGRYVEWIAVRDKDITIAGEGDRADIVLQSTVDSTVHVADAALTLSNLSVVGQDYGFAIDVAGTGSSAILEGVDLRSIGSYEYDHTPIRWSAGATGALRDSTVEGKVDVATGASATIEDNIMRSSCIEVGADAAAVIRRNIISGCPLGYGIAVRGGAAEVVGNDIAVPASDVVPAFGVVEDRVGIVVATGSDAVTIRDNDIHDSRTGLSAASDATIEGNEIVGNEVGIASSASLEIGPGNRVCENGRNVDPAGPVATSDSGICPDPSPGPG